jgi:hypothetical protein
MPQYKEEDQEIKESYEEYSKLREEQTKTTAKSLLSSISPRVLIGLVGIVFFMAYLTFIQKAMEERTFFWFVIGILIVIMVLGAQGDNARRQLIPEPQLKAILKTKLKDKQRISPSEIPNGDIEVLLPCKLKKIEGNPTKYVFSFKITSPGGLEKVYTAEMNPYDGYLMGFEERPMGFKGTEVTDVNFIRRKEDVWEQKYFKYRRGQGGGGAPPSGPPGQ